MKQAGGDQLADRTRPWIRGGEHAAPNGVIAGISGAAGVIEILEELRGRHEPVLVDTRQAERSECCERERVVGTVSNSGKAAPIRHGDELSA